MARNHNITAMEIHEFAMRVAAGEHPTDVAEDLGYKNPSSSGSMLARHPLVVEKIREANNRLMEKTNVTRETISQGLLEAIDQAKVLSDPTAQIAGWRELAKLHGLNAPEQKTVNIAVTHNGELSHQLKAIPSHELEKLVSGEFIEGVVADASDRIPILQQAEVIVEQIAEEAPTAKRRRKQRDE